MSECHACALAGLNRDTYRHVGQTSAFNVELREQIVPTAHTRRLWGYRMINDVLRPQCPNINHKRVYRLYTAEGCQSGNAKRQIGLACAGLTEYCDMESRLQRDQAAQQLCASVACNILRLASSVNWRCKAKVQERCRAQLILQASDFWKLDWHGDWGQVASRCLFKLHHRNL
jgi:hypothetical protein